MSTHSNPQNLVIEMLQIGEQTLRVARRRSTDPDTNPNPPLLLFNGIGANLELTFPFIRAMRNHDIIVFDIPGIGESPLPAFPYRLRHLVKLSCKLLDYFDIEQVDVLGVSWGGGLAQEFAYREPSRCRKCIFAATATGAVMFPAKFSILSKLISPKRYLEPGYMAKIAPELYGGDVRDNPRHAGAFARLLNAHGSTGYYYQLFAAAGWTSLHWLHKIKQPTLIMAGDDDPLIPINNAKLMHWRIPNSTLYIAKNAGHLFLLTRAPKKAKIIKDFLKAT